MKIVYFYNKNNSTWTFYWESRNGVVESEKVDGPLRFQCLGLLRRLGNELIDMTRETELEAARRVLKGADDASGDSEREVGRV